MGLFSWKSKNRKQWCVLYMHCGMSGQLHDVIDSMEERSEFVNQLVRLNFMHVLHPAELKRYGEKNMRGYFPDQWPSPIYKKLDPKFDETARQCVRSFIKRELPEVDIDNKEITIMLHAGGGFAWASFEY